MAPDAVGEKLDPRDLRPDLSVLQPPFIHNRHYHPIENHAHDQKKTDCHRETLLALG